MRGELKRHCYRMMGAVQDAEDCVQEALLCGWREFSSLRDEKTRPIGREGTAASHWVLVDFGSVIVHIFTPPEREYYGLEKHWSEAKTILSVQ